MNSNTFNIFPIKFNAKNDIDLTCYKNQVSLLKNEKKSLLKISDCNSTLCLKVESSEDIFHIFAFYTNQKTYILSCDIEISKEDLNGILKKLSIIFTEEVKNITLFCGDKKVFYDINMLYIAFEKAYITLFFENIHQNRNIVMLNIKNAKSYKDTLNILSLLSFENKKSLLNSFEKLHFCKNLHEDEEHITIKLDLQLGDENYSSYKFLRF